MEFIPSDRNLNKIVVRRVTYARKLPVILSLVFLFLSRTL